MAKVQFTKFLNTGVGLFRRPLGALDSPPLFFNAVEMQFSFDADAKARFPGMKIIQWAGPEAIFVKEGALLEGPWKTHRSGMGSGDDTPDPDNVLRHATGFAAYDNPGMDIKLALAAKRYTAVFIVQNFTTWIDSKGGDGERISDTAAWHSMLLIVNGNPSTGVAVMPQWSRFRGHAREGWRDHRLAPDVLHM